MLALWLARDEKFEAASHFAQQRLALARKSYPLFFSPRIKDVLRQCEQYGVEHRLPMNQTPLMAAAAAGNVVLVEALLERGADREACDHYGRNALHWAMLEAFHDPKYANGPFGALYALLAPPAIDINTGQRLVRIERHLSEYFLFQTLWVLFKSRFTHPPQKRANGAFETQAILDAWQHLPTSVVRPERNKRQFLSGVLARNEVERDYAYNRALFTRVTQGWYQFNFALSVRRRHGEEERWVPVFEALNLPLINEFCWDDGWLDLAEPIADYLRAGGLGERSNPVGAERAAAKQQALQQEKIALEAQRIAIGRQWMATQDAERRSAGKKPK
jgi:hypothetical protein